MTLYLDHQLKKRAQKGNLRELNSSPPLIDFSSNDTLGLARSPKLVEAVHREWQRESSSLNGLGATGSRLLSGNSAYAEQLEEKIAQFHGYEAALLFNCGYMANVGLLSTVATQNSLIFFDSQIHASTRDGIRLSRAAAFAFRHNDCTHLKERLDRFPSQKERFICIESLYSTDGSLAPIDAISELAERYGAHLIVDEAHAVGVLGPQGKGLVAAEQLSSKLFAQVVTFGKALGTYGAVVLGNQRLKKALINFATSYIYTTALPFHALAAINCSYDLFPSMEKEREEIKELISHVRTSLNSLSHTHIHPLFIKGNQAVKSLSHLLEEKGVTIKPLMSPTVQRGKECLRLCLHTFNTKKEIDALISYLK